MFLVVIYRIECFNMISENNRRYNESNSRASGIEPEQMILEITVLPLYYALILVSVYFDLYPFPLC